MVNWQKYVSWSSTSSEVDPDEVRETNAKIGDSVYVDGVEVFQDANGAPVEQASPLGYHVSGGSIILLNVSQMVGTGIFSTPGSILKTLGSVGLSLLFWVIGAVIAWAAQCLYLEYTAWFPNRSGSQVVYLEQAYPRPKLLLPAMYAFFTIAFSFSSSNAIVLARYIFRAAGYTATEWENKGLAIGGYVFLATIALVSNKWSLRLSNLLSAVKLIILLFVVITGFVILGGGTSIEDPRANFRNAFEGTTDNGNGIVNALVKLNFAYQGYANAFNMTGEIRNAQRKLKIAAPISLLLVTILYVLANVAYFAAIPADKIKASGELTASLFFEAVFGPQGKAVGALVAVSAAGNILAVIIGATRGMREAARQGLLPLSHIWVSTKPFGTPFAPILCKLVLTVIVIIALPFGDAFNFLVDLRSYPDSAFLCLMCIGIYLLRRQRAKQGLPRASYEAWHVAIIFSIAVCIFLLVMPWYPPLPGSSDVSFWYATYCAVGVALMVGCVVYYALWIWVVPRLRHYQIRTETVVLDDGSVSHRLLRVPNSEVMEYDRRHDAAGDLIADSVTGVDEEQRRTEVKGLVKRVHIKDSRPSSYAFETQEPKV